MSNELWGRRRESAGTAEDDAAATLSAPPAVVSRAVWPCIAERPRARGSRPPTGGATARHAASAGAAAAPRPGGGGDREGAPTVARARVGEPQRVHSERLQHRAEPCGTAADAGLSRHQRRYVLSAFAARLRSLSVRASRRSRRLTHEPRGRAQWSTTCTTSGPPPTRSTPVQSSHW
jgi:hypothetical protein